VREEADIVFVSAHDGYAIRAFEVNALDYLRKPLRTARLAEALKRVAQSSASDSQLSALNPQPPASALALTDIASVKTGPGAMRFVPVADIVTITSQDNYSEVHLTNGSHFLVRSTLAAWEERLPATHFLRVHRRTILNLARVEGFEHQDEETTSLRVSGLADPVRARREHWPELRKRLAALGRTL
jgi:two-component system LytT family response regulator